MHGRMLFGGRPLRALLTTACALALAPTANAFAADHPVSTVIQDDKTFLYPDADNQSFEAGTAAVKAALDQVKSLGIDTVRVTASWNTLVPEKPAGDASDPASYERNFAWEDLDRLVRLADAAGLRVMIDAAFWAPQWAAQVTDTPDRPRTNIDMAAYAQFATAIARRYDGTFVPTWERRDATPQQQQCKTQAPTFLDKLFGHKPQSCPPPPPPEARPQPLPKVSMFTLWNEPNGTGFLMPQWTKEGDRWVATSADTYRSMVQAAYPAIKAARPDSTILIGATSAKGGSEPGKGGVPPLAFIRRLACVDEHLDPISDGACANFRKVPGDGWSHHPYSLTTEPDEDSSNPDDLPVAATSRLTSTLRTLVREGRLDAAVANVYMTEYGYETNPPVPTNPWSPEDQALLLPWAEFIATRDPAVKMWPQFLLRDYAGDPDNHTNSPNRPNGQWQSGLEFGDGTPKPALASFRTPAVAQCLPGARTLQLWGRVRGGGAQRLAVDVQAPGQQGWAPLALAQSPRRRAARSAEAIPPSPDGFVRYAPVQEGAQYRLRWTDADGEHTGPAFTAVGCEKAAKLARARAARARRHHRRHRGRRGRAHAARKGHRGHHRRHHGRRHRHHRRHHQARRA